MLITKTSVSAAAIFLLLVVMAISGVFATDRAYFITHSPVSVGDGTAFGSAYTVTLDRRLGKDRAVYRAPTIEAAIATMRELSGGA